MEQFLDVAFILVIAGLMLAGQMGTILPIIPGLWLQWAAALVYGVVSGFGTSGTILFAIISGLVIGGSLLDNLVMGVKAKTGGAGWVSVVVSLIAVVIGSIAWPPLGGLLLGMAAIFLVEYLRVKDLDKAWESTRNLAVGCGWGVVLQFFFGLLVIGVWLIWVFFYS